MALYSCRRYRGFGLQALSWGGGGSHEFVAEMRGLAACTVYEYALSASLVGDAHVHQSWRPWDRTRPCSSTLMRPRTSAHASTQMHTEAHACQAHAIEAGRGGTNGRRYSVGSEAGGYSEWFSFAQPPQVATDTCAR